MSAEEWRAVLTSSRSSSAAHCTPLATGSQLDVRVARESANDCMPSVTPRAPSDAAAARCALATPTIAMCIAGYAGVPTAGSVTRSVCGEQQRDRGLAAHALTVYTCMLSVTCVSVRRALVIGSCCQPVLGRGAATRYGAVATDQQLSSGVRGHGAAAQIAPHVHPDALQCAWELAQGMMLSSACAAVARRSLRAALTCRLAWVADAHGLFPWGRLMHESRCLLCLYEGHEPSCARRVLEAVAAHDGAAAWVLVQLPATSRRAFVCVQQCPRKASTRALSVLNVRKASTCELVARTYLCDAASELAQSLPELWRTVTLATRASLSVAGTWKTNMCDASEGASASLLVVAVGLVVCAL
jgi:hypothetical protein